MHWEKEGAFTGEVSVAHARRRRAATTASSATPSVARCSARPTRPSTSKVKALLAGGHHADRVLRRDARDPRRRRDRELRARARSAAALDGITAEQAAGLVIAYEPIWAIGTGRTPTPEAANDVCRSIRATVGALFGQPVAIQVRVLYGGSAKPENIALFMPEPDIDGALVGGASLDADSFVSMVATAAGLRRK